MKSGKKILGAAKTFDFSVSNSQDNPNGEKDVPD